MTGRTAGNWYFGWNIVAAAALLTLLTVGMRMGIGPFFLPMARDLGFSRSLLAGIVAVGMLCYGLGMPLAAHLVARFGTRAVLLAGTAIVAASTVWTVLARDAISFLLAFGVLMSVGLAFTGPVAVTPVISRWFSRRRGMALFFLSTGSMAGIAVMTPVLTLAIETLGWQATLLGFAAAFSAITVPLALFVIRDNAPAHADLLPEQIVAAAPTGGSDASPQPLSFGAAIRTAPFVQVCLGLFTCGFSAITVPLALFVIRDNAPAHADLLPEQIVAAVPSGGADSSPVPLSFGAAIRTAPFVKVCLGLFTCGFSMNLLGTHGMPMLMDHGYDATTSSLGIGLIGLVAIFGTLVLGRLSDRLPRRNLLATIYFVRGLGFFALLVVGTHWELYLAATIGGIVWAGSIALSSAILADVYGVRLVGILYGWAYLGHQVGGTISSWLGGWAYDTFGTHWVAFGASGVLLLLAAALSLRLPVKGFTLMAPTPVAPR